MIIFISVAIFVDPILLDGRGSYATALPFRAARKPKPTRAFQPAEYKRESDDCNNTETGKDRRENAAAKYKPKPTPMAKASAKRYRVPRGVNIGSRFERFRLRPVDTAGFGLVCSIGLPYGLPISPYRHTTLKAACVAIRLPAIRRKRDSPIWHGHMDLQKQVLECPGHAPSARYTRARRSIIHH